MDSEITLLSAHYKKNVTVAVAPHYPYDYEFIAKRLAGPVISVRPPWSVIR